MEPVAWEGNAMQGCRLVVRITHGRIPLGARGSGRSCGKKEHQASMAMQKKPVTAEGRNTPVLQMMVLTGMREEVAMKPEMKMGAGTPAGKHGPTVTGGRRSAMQRAGILHRPRVHTAQVKVIIEGVGLVWKPRRVPHHQLLLGRHLHLRPKGAQLK